MKMRYVLIAIISVVSLIAVAHYSDLRIDMQKVDYRLFGLGFLVFVLNYTLRAVRFSRLLEDRPDTRALWAATGIHGSLNYLIPARLGELSFPLLARYMAGVPAERAVAALVASRMLDILLVLVVLVAVIFSGIISLPQNVFSAHWILLVFLLFISAGWAVRAGIVRSAVSRLPFIRGKCLRVLTEMLLGLEAVSWQQLCVSLALTLGIWCAIWLNFYFLAHAVGCPLDWSQAVAISLILVPLSLVPVQGVANLGTFELAWSLVLAGSAVGIDRALGWTFEVHLLLSLHVVMLGLLSCILWWVQRNARRLPEQDHE